MSVSKALYGSVENSIIGLVLRKGCPVLEEGKENPLLAEHGYASSAWKDSTTNSHVKGGATYNEYERRWVSFDGCNWDFRDAVLTNDTVDEATGKLVLEVDGLICTCGQYSSKKVRYSGKKDVVLKEITNEIQRNLANL